MTLISGTLMSAYLANEKTYASIPGLFSWHQPSVGVIKDSSNRVSRIQDLSGNGRDIYQSSNGKMPILTTYNGYTCVNSQGASANAKVLEMTGKQGDIKFLHNGGKFGVFFIFANLTTDTTTAQSPVPLITRSSGTTEGYQLVVVTNANKRVQANVVNSIGTSVLSHFSPVNSFPNGDVHYLGHVSKGMNITANDSIFYKDSINISTGAASTNTVSNNNSSLVPQLFQAGNANNERVLYFLSVIYNWTAYSNTEIDGFVAEVNQITNKNFTGLI